MPMIDREKIKSAFPFLTRFIHWIKRRKNELSALPRHLRRKRAQKKNSLLNHGIIKVVFLCQYIPAWSKDKQLYEALRNDERFEVTLLCVPNRISANQLQDPEDLSNDTYEYFSSHGYKEAVNALIGKNEWRDLQAQHPDYVICNRYDRPMPIPYTSSVLSNYTRICLVPYDGVALRRVKDVVDKLFVANSYCGFVGTEEGRRNILRSNSILCKLKLSHAVCCGISSIENTYKAKLDPCETWDFSKNRFRVIYAPRWTTDPTWGGSSFLQYRDTFFDLADKHPEIAFFVRPHPLMFDNFVKNGLMTVEEVEAYKGQCKSRTNIRIDDNKEYYPTFWNSSVMICDFSSILVEYFVTEKPIIYLTYDEKIEYNELMLAMLSGCYIVNSEQELVKALEDLAAGKDPLAARRAEVCRKYLLCGSNFSASENMKQFLIDHYTD
ncbi:MAG: CDP-glycerol glycerophosphotransferase family protein [Oscillospiraceae bacterium]|nr:CDP-glycerol glycerophosphotransferase family protein [Oscillospiraceae bacterium]MBR3474576.1 CDP-glycerol glycerophosphotransferase family protein [Oscillospiraceae bacterium]